MVGLWNPTDCRSHLSSKRLEVKREGLAFQLLLYGFSRTVIQCTSYMDYFMMPLWYFPESWKKKTVKKKKKRKRFWACYPFGLTWKALTTHVTFNLFCFFSHYPLVKTWHKEYCFQVQSSSHFSWEYYLKSHWWAMQVSQHPEHQYFNDS